MEVLNTLTGLQGCWDLQQGHRAQETPATNAGHFQVSHDDDILETRFKSLISKENAEQ